MIERMVVTLSEVDEEVIGRYDIVTLRDERVTRLLLRHALSTF
jgi:hypothetical protein